MTQVEIDKASLYILYKYFNYFSHYGLTREDFIQTGQLVYLNAFKSKKEGDPEITLERLLTLLRTEFKKSMKQERAYTKIVSMSDYWHEQRSIDDEESEFHSPGMEALYNKLSIAIDTLTEQEKYCTYNTFLSTTPKSKTELGLEMKLSPQRIGQILKSAKEKVYDYFEENSL